MALPLGVMGQIGGNSVYDFVDLPSSYRQSAMGGDYITVMDNDVSLAYHAPSLLNPSMHHRLKMSTVVFFDGINFGNFAYARHFDKINTTFHTGAQYVTYGKFDRTNAIGDVEGEFGAGETALFIGGAHQIDNYSFGANMKLVFSQFDSYISVGSVFDFAATYNDTAKLFTATLLIKNVGFQWKPYRDGMREPVPFDVQIGFSKRFKHLPFRISIVAHDLANWNLRYDNPIATDDDAIFGDTTSTSDNKKVGEFFDNVARHFTVGGELYLGKFARIGFAYNHQRRQEMKVETKKGLVGFSFGLAIIIKQFEFGFARQRYHIAGASNQITVGIDLGKFGRKKITKAPPSSDEGENL